MNVRNRFFVASALAVVAIGVLIAQTIATRDFPIDGIYWISLPASPNPPVTNAEQLLAYGPFTSVARHRTETNLLHTWDGTTCANGIDPDSQGPTAPCSTSCFCVIPGESYQVTVSGAPQTWSIDGSDGVTVYPLAPMGPDSLTGRHQISLPIDLPDGFATGSHLINDINFKAGVPLGIVQSVSRYLTSTNTIQTYTGRMGSPGPDFPLVPGEGYRVNVTGSLNYTPPLGPTWTDPCIAPDVNGTIVLPPICGYLSPSAVHILLDGLPPGTEVLLDASHQRFFNITPVVPLAGAATTETFDSDLVMHLTGTGLLAGVDCDLTMSPVSVVVETQPPQAGQPVQDFDAEMMSATGSLISDTTCNLFQSLSVVAGTNHGLPSPGHVHLERRADGTFNVSSFFDVNVTMSFVGKPGSLLDGMSGSTTQVIRMGTASNILGITLSPSSATNRVGTSHAVTATVNDLVGHPQPGAPVTFTVISGPNAGASGACSVDVSCATDPSGSVDFTYTSDGQVGTDQITACFRNEGGQQECAQAMKDWVACGPDGAPCSDDSACTTNDACLSQVCVGVPVVCDDDDPCTGDSCDSGTGCVFTFMDADHDEVCDFFDECPSSDLGLTVSVAGCETDVGNTRFPDGCTLQDRVNRCGVGVSHGAFVSCVASLTNDLKAQGVLSGRQKGRIQRCAATSNPHPAPQVIRTVGERG